MKKYYIVCRTESPKECLELVSAESQEELEDKAFDLLCDDYFLEDVNSYGFMEIFYRDDQGSLFEDLTGNNRSGIDNAYIESCIRSNVSNFFKEKPEYGDLYLKDFFNEKRSMVEFPRELYKFIFFNYDNEAYIIKQVNI